MSGRLSRFWAGRSAPSAYRFDVAPRIMSARLPATFTALLRQNSFDFAVTASFFSEFPPTIPHFIELPNK